MQPLPEGGLPSDQTIEGGAQIRISDNGFQKLTEIIPAVLQDTLGQGTCIPEGGFAIIDYCHENDGSCSPGCQADITIDSVIVDVPQDDELRVAIQFDVDINVPVEADLFLGTIGCDINATASDILFDVIIGFDIEPQTGELELNLQRISDVNIAIDIDASDCGSVIDAVASLVSGIINGIGAILDVGFIRDLLTPVIEPIVQGLLPDPLGVEGIADMGALIGDVSPGTRARMETRIVPGGYVHLERGGLSLGIITGINADQDITTRTAELDSETALCVPAFAAPDFGVAPANLAQSSRSNFKLNPANLFRGVPETGSDVIIGVSETMLDQLGHHLITSGTMCLSLGTELIPQLNLGTIGILVPSLAELGTEEGNDPLLLVTRPAKPIDFSIGDGTEASPSITMYLSEFNIDFYAFLFERYTRGFTVTLDMKIGINLEFTTDADGNAAVMPILVGLESDNIGVTVLNEEFLAEDAATLETVFPVLLDLVLPLIGDGLGSFGLPEFSGFKLDNVGVARVTTSEDDFLALDATLGAGSMMMALGQIYPSVDALVGNMKMTEGTAASASARLVEVIAPTPTEMRAALAGQAGGKSPGIVLDLDTHDQMGRELEWTWNIEGGIWRPLIRGGQVTLRDGAFHIQGKYDIQLRSRAAGDYHSWSQDIATVSVVIDSVGPRILTESIETNEGTLLVSAFDTVFENQVEIAFGIPSAKTPSTTWAQSGEISMEQALALAEDGEVQIFARDPQGNESSTDYRIADADSVSTGGCSTSGSNTGLAGLLLVVLVLAFRQRRPKLEGGNLLALLVLGTLSMTQACTCSSSAANSCDIDEECMDLCEPGEIGQCLDSECRCLKNVPYGYIGQYSAMDVAADGTVWVSAYNSEHGDLMVASTRSMGRIPNELWSFVDGVPDGPVVLPASAVRGGIKAEGEDVGQYTDLTIAPDGTVMISYFDASTGSLKFAANDGGEWHAHVVDMGDLSDDDVNTTKLSGQYSAISVNRAGIPSIAYFAHVGIGTEEATTELRFAQASSTQPRAQDAWSVNLVDDALVPASETEEDILTIPYGTGLFADVTRDMEDLPVLAYYDRINGDLKLARFSVESGEFAVETLDEQGDVGWYPSVIVDNDGVVHVSYVDAVNQDLLYINDTDRVAQLVDDGYRLVGSTADGLPIPEFHFVGDDSSIVLTPDGTFIVYQDATTHELLVAYSNQDSSWGRTNIAGDEAPFVGAYGFFANGVFDGTDVTMSSWVLHQGAGDAWVELFRRSIVID